MCCIISLVFGHLCILWYLIELFAVIVESDTTDVGVGLGVRVAHEGREAREEDVADDTQGPHVCRAIIALSDSLWEVVYINKITSRKGLKL